MSTPSESPETYVSVDIETTGLIGGLHHMIALGAVAFSSGKGFPALGMFSVNIQHPLSGLEDDPATLAWWRRQGDAWEIATRDPQHPVAAMLGFALWLERLPAPRIFVGYPAEFDSAFVRYYLQRFAGRVPFAHGAIDLKTLAFTLLGGRYDDARQAHWPGAWKATSSVVPAARPHVALDDARVQGDALKSMLTAIQALHLGLVHSQ